VGSFDEVNLPALSGDLAWDATSLQTTGQLRIVPEPGIGALLLAGLVLLGTRRAHQGARTPPPATENKIGVPRFLARHSTP
jgi:hypothetical protein